MSAAISKSASSSKTSAAYNQLIWAYCFTDNINLKLHPLVKFKKIKILKKILLPLYSVESKRKYRVYVYITIICIIIYSSQCVIGNGLLMKGNAQ